MATRAQITKLANKQGLTYDEFIKLKMNENREKLRNGKNSPGESPKGKIPSKAQITKLANKQGLTYDQFVKLKLHENRETLREGSFKNTNKEVENDFSSMSKNELIGYITDNKILEQTGAKKLNTTELRNLCEVIEERKLY